MKKACFLLVLFTLLFVSCTKEPEPPKEIHFSILGDSYSAYEGSVYPESNDVCNYYGEIGVDSLEMMWWYQVAQSMGWILERNNSFYGSLISNTDVGSYYVRQSFLNRMDNLGNPDVILVFGGTNDIWYDAPMGKFQYENWSEEDLCFFRPALACLFNGLQGYYPNAKLYFMADAALGEVFVESVHTITDHYGIRCIDLHDIEKLWGHPVAAGMDTIAAQVLAALNE